MEPICNLDFIFFVGGLLLFFSQGHQKTPYPALMVQKSILFRSWKTEYTNVFCRCFFGKLYLKDQVFEHLFFDQPFSIFLRTRKFPSCVSFGWSPVFQAIQEFLLLHLRSGLWDLHLRDLEAAKVWEVFLMQSPRWKKMLLKGTCIRNFNGPGSL